MSRFLSLAGYRAAGSRYVRRGMYTIKVISSFSAAHSLREYQGKCENLHGHNWKVEAVVASAELDRAGMVMDFGELKLLLNRVLDSLDHRHLNELSYFSVSEGRNVNPSSEEIARYIFEKLSEPIGKNQCSLQSISVWETSNACATYMPK